MPASSKLTLDDLSTDTALLAEDLGRPLRYVQINSAYGGSTGSIMHKLHDMLVKSGVDSYEFWGRGHDTVDLHRQCCSSKMGVYVHATMTRLTDRTGFYSRFDTKRLLEYLNTIDPDIVHLHNLHGYYINIEMLFKWLANHRCQVRWTLHDCWAFTGHCAYFSAVQCNQWQGHCASKAPCPQLNTYPRSICKTNCSNNYADKKKIFTSVSPKRMTLISPSQWLADLAQRSFFKGYPIMVRYNTIDTNLYKPTPSSFRYDNSIGTRYMVLGVASPWTERKGLLDFIRLANDLSSSGCAIVLVGLAANQIRNLPEGIIGLNRTDSSQELAAIYTAADVLFNPTKEDNYPTVNLEAEACGTPVISYDTGGCVETLQREDSCVVQSYEDALSVIAGRCFSLQP